jgi:hypothetical protein
MSNESEDLATLKLTLASVRESFFSMAAMIDRADDDAMAAMGYKNFTRNDAIAYCYRQTLKRMKKLESEFISKYPDSWAFWCTGY